MTRGSTLTQAIADGARSPFGPSVDGPRFVYDHTSVLKMIEWAFLSSWRIPPGAGATHRDAIDDTYIGNLACALSVTTGQ